MEAGLPDVTASIPELNAHFWSELSKKCGRAAVFLDSPAAECLHWAGGVARLGTTFHSVHQFSPGAAVPPSCHKAVFVLSGAVCGEREAALRAVVRASQLHYCILVTTCGDQDRAQLDSLEDRLLEWMGDHNYTVEILLLPLFLVCLGPRLLLTPAHAGLVVGEENMAGLAGSLHSLLGSLGVGAEVWSLGPAARQLGEQLVSLPTRNTTTQQNTASLLLVDRGLDWAGPARPSTTTLLARVTAGLDRIPGHTVDVGVSLAWLLGLHPEAGPHCLPPAGLAGPGTRPAQEQQELESLVFGTEKDGLAVLHRNLGGTTRSPSTAALEQQLSKLVNNTEAVLSNLASVSRAAAVVAASSNSLAGVARKRLASLQAQLGRAVLEGGDRALVDLADLTRQSIPATLDELLTLLVFLYSALDTRDEVPGPAEDRVKAGLAEAVVRCGLHNSVLAGYTTAPLDELVAHGLVDRVWSRLASLRQARQGLGRYHSLLNREGEYCGLLEQLLTDLYSEDRREVECLHHHQTPGSLGSMLRTGLGWLGSQTKPHPRNNPWILLVVVGGVSPAEAALCQSLVRGTGRLTVLGTRLLSPTDTLDLVLSSGQTDAFRL